MNLKTLSTLILLITLSGCSSSSSNSSDGASDSLGAGLTLRLISSQSSSSDGRSTGTNYEYDETGNLIREVRGEFILTYNIEPDGRIIEVIGSNDGVPADATLLYSYDEAVGLKRIDNRASIEGDVIGVSGISIYKFENGLATSLESRQIPFDEITVNGRPDDSAGFITGIVEYKYDGDRLIQALFGVTNADGTIDEAGQRDYAYNPDGTLASTGRAGTTTVYSYEQGACNHNWGNSTHRYFCVAGDDL